MDGLFGSTFEPLKTELGKLAKSTLKSPRDIDWWPMGRLLNIFLSQRRSPPQLALLATSLISSMGLSNNNTELNPIHHLPHQKLARADECTARKQSRLEKVAAIPSTLQPCRCSSQNLLDCKANIYKLQVAKDKH